MFRILVVVLVLMAASVFSVRVIDQSGRMPANATTEKPKAQAPTNSRIVVIKSENGHFGADAYVDGRRIAFMVDTGASQIAIRASDAARLGYHPRAHDYTIKVDTANGVGRAALVELNRVEIGDIMLRDVPALVVPDEALNVNLLGMSFLSRVRWTHEPGRLVLEQ
jgi:aspartyl protease family protein